MVCSKTIGNGLPGMVTVKVQKRTDQALVILLITIYHFKLTSIGCRCIETSPGTKKIEGLYSITRGIGFHGDKHVKKFINPTPTVKSFRIESNYICIIVATKGLWSVLSYEKVAYLVQQVTFFDQKV
jgi:hypothetical protein